MTDTYDWLGTETNELKMSQEAELESNTTNRLLSFAKFLFFLGIICSSIGGIILFLNRDRNLGRDILFCSLSLGNLICFLLVFNGFDALAKKMVSFEIFDDYLALVFWSLTVLLVSKLLNINRDVQRLFVGVFISCLLFLIEKKFIQFIGFKYHQKSFSHKIIESTFAEYLINKILKRPLESNWPLFNQSSLDVERPQDTLTLSEFQQANHLKKSLKIKTDFQAKCDARDLFNTLAETNEFLSKENFISILGEQAGLEAFLMFDFDFNEKISKSETKQTITRIYKSKRNLIKSLSSAKNAINSLDWILVIIVAIISVLIILSVLEIRLRDYLTAFSVGSLGLAFASKDFIGQLIDCILFIFFTHPFDVGDLVVIDSKEFLVEQVSLTLSIFKDSKGTETYIQNSSLVQKMIQNISRSKEQTTNFSVKTKSTLDQTKLKQLNLEIFKFLKENSSFYFSDFEFCPVELNPVDNFNFLVKFKFKQTNDPKKRFERHLKVNRFLFEVIQRLEI